MSLTIEDLSLLLLGGIVIVSSEKSSDTREKDAPKEVILQRKLRDFRLGASNDPTLIKKKEAIIVSRGLSLPSVNPNNPSLYEANLDYLINSSQSLPKPNEFPWPLEPVYPTALPNAGKKSSTELFMRAGRMSGLTIPLISEPDEATWVS